jgi:tetratricopeptide (TPR) repeat protein
MQDVARLQQEIAREVAGDLPVVINAAGLKRWSRTQAIEPESYDRYLRGRTFLNRGSRESIERALDLFAEAVRLDPRNSYALAATAAAHAQLAGGRTATPAKTVHDARSAAKAALTIDPGSAEAHAVLAEMSFFADWDWDGAEADYRQALSLNPSLEYARERYSMFLASRGRLDQAVVEIEEAMRVNPASLRLAAARAGLLNYARRHEEAAAEYERVLAGDPEHVAANVGLGRLFNATGRFHEALAIYTRLHARDPGDSFVEGQLAQALAGLGRHEAARTIVERLERDSASGARFVQPGTIAYVHASLRDSDRAFSWLGRAVAERSPGVLWLKVDPRVDSLRNDPRFDGLLRDFGGR